VARARAKNFYYAFRVLDAPRRDALCAIYAFMRHCDDLADEPGASAQALEEWRLKLDSALSGGNPIEPVWPGFADAVRRYKIPPHYFHDMIDGVTSDISRTEVATFAELYRYCYQVASVAGLSLVHIFGYRSEKALVLAEKCGIAFQLTNIVRDVAEDLGNGRIYLPLEDRERFRVAQIADTPEFAELMRFEAERARAYYDESRPLLTMVNPACRPSLWALIEIYRRLLCRIERSNFDVLSRRIQVPTIEKYWIMARAAASQFNYSLWNSDSE
jgi:15-cis-phytoene synthase